MESEKLIFSAGKHHAEPLLVEAEGEERRVSMVLEADAKLHLTAFVLASSGNARLSVEVDLTGEGAEFHLHGLYIASGTGAAPGAAGKSAGLSAEKTAGHADISVRVNHLAPDCVSRQLIKGIAAGGATGVFSGMVHVARGAQRTDASQRNQNLQLTDTAHVFTRPQLEIYADDVKCSHGATIGRLDDEAIYYMRQRGVSEAEARRMQLHGFAGEIINHCPSAASREAIGEKIYAEIKRF